MTFQTKNLNVGRVDPKFRIFGVWFNMMPMKAFFRTASLAFTNLLNSFLDNPSDRMSSFGRPAIPSWMVLSTGRGGFSAAFNRTISTRSPIPLSLLKRAIAAETDILYHYFKSFGLDLIRAFWRTAGCVTSDMGIMTHKFFTANRTNKATLALCGNSSKLISIAHSIQYRASLVGVQ